MGLTDFRPLVSVSINGTPLAQAFYSRIISVNLTDRVGLTSDTLSVEFDNSALIDRMVMPEPGAELEVAMGYAFGLRPMGVFVADEVEEVSPPRRISVFGRAKSQGVTSGGQRPISQQKTRSWDDGLTLGDIVRSIAAENGLTAAIADAAASIVPGHLDQLDESDISLLSRVGLQYDMIAKPAGGSLVVTPVAGGVSTSGQAMPAKVLPITSISKWGVRRSLGQKVGSVVASYRDIDAAQTIEVAVGSGEPVMRLKARYKDEGQAQAAAKAELQRLVRQAEVLTIDMPGDASIVAESKVSPLGLSSAAVGEWVVQVAQHNIDRSGYRTSFEAVRTS